MPSYFCHNCSQTKSENEIKFGNEGITCSDCDSDFLEEITSQNQLEFNPFALHFAAHSSASQESNEGSQASGESHGARRDGPATIRLFTTVPGRRSEFDQMLMPIFNMLGIRNMGPIDDLHSLDDIVTQLLNQMDNSGPPPASNDELSRIQPATITSAQVEQGLQCFVCFDDFKESEDVERLPCQHHFHHSCIRPWLEKHGTCPVCRKTLAGEDTSTQIYAQEAAAEEAQRQSTNAAASGEAAVSDSVVQQQASGGAASSSGSGPSASANPTQHHHFLEEKDFD